MARMLGAIGVCVALGLVIPAWAADDKKDADKKPTYNEKEFKAKYVLTTQLQGKLTRVEADKRIFELEVPAGRNQTKKYEYSALDELTVYSSHPPVELDDNGKPKKVAYKDRKKPVKGPGNLRGYPADVSDLHTGQIVIAAFFQKKGVKPSKGLVDDNKAMIGGILIVADPKK